MLAGVSPRSGDSFSLGLGGFSSHAVDPVVGRVSATRASFLLFAFRDRGIGPLAGSRRRSRLEAPFARRPVLEWRGQWANAAVYRPGGQCPGIRIRPGDVYAPAQSGRARIDARDL